MGSLDLIVSTSILSVKEGSTVMLASPFRTGPRQHDAVFKIGSGERDRQILGEYFVCHETKVNLPHPILLRCMDAQDFVDHYSLEGGHCA
jgi:hypothetical protein